MPHHRHITVVALVVVVVTIGAVWNVGAYRGSLEHENPVGVAEGASTVGATNVTTTTARPTPTPTPTATSVPPPTSSPAAAKDAETVTATATATPTPTPVPDYDGDGIPDTADRCPTRPETNNGFEDGDGCPDVVATTGAS